MPEPPATILVVDDQPEIVTLGRRMLEVSGFAVTGSTSPRDALAEFTAHPDEFDAVVTDYLMPELTGLELIERLSGARPDLATLLLTGWTDPGSSTAGGVANRVLPKPFTRAELTDAVTAALREVQDLGEARFHV